VALEYLEELNLLAAVRHEVHDGGGERQLLHALGHLPRDLSV